MQEIKINYWPHRPRPISSYFIYASRSATHFTFPTDLLILFRNLQCDRLSLVILARCSLLFPLCISKYRWACFGYQNFILVDEGIGKGYVACCNVAFVWYIISVNFPVSSRIPEECRYLSAIFRLVSREFCTVRDGILFEIPKALQSLLLLQLSYLLVGLKQSYLFDVWFWWSSRNTIHVRQHT